MQDLNNHVNPHTKKRAPLVSDEFWSIVEEHADQLNSAIIYDRDFSYNYFGFKTLEKSYLMRINGTEFLL